MSDEKKTTRNVADVMADAQEGVRRVGDMIRDATKQVYVGFERKAKDYSERLQTPVRYYIPTGQSIGSSTKHDGDGSYTFSLGAYFFLEKTGELITDCPDCDGRGNTGNPKDPTDPCMRCKGLGVLRAPKDEPADDEAVH